MDNEDAILGRGTYAPKHEETMPKPKPRPTLTVGSVTVRAVAGPDPAKRYRWRLEWYPSGKKGAMETKPLAARGEWLTALDAETRALAAVPLLKRPAPILPTEIHTVEDLLNTWLALQELRSDLQRSSYEIRERGCVRLMGPKSDEPAKGAPRLRYFQLAGLDEEDLVQHRDARLKRGEGGETITLDFRFLRQAWRWGQKVGAVGTRTLSTPTAKGGRRYSSYTPSPAEVLLVLGRLRQPWMRAALQLLWGTGARVGEISALTWGDVDQEGGRLTLTGKTGTRTIPITPRARMGLAELAPPPGAPEHPAEQRLFTLKDLGNNTRGAVKKALRPTLEEQERKVRLPPPFSPHGLRRLAVDDLRRAGVQLEVVARITGHSVQTMLRFYRRPTDLEVEAALSRAPLGEVPAGTLLHLVPLALAAGDEPPLPATPTNP